MLQWRQAPPGPIQWSFEYNGVLVQLSLTMQQESQSKRLVFGLGINYHFVDYIEWGYSVNIEILKLTFNRGFAFRGRSELAKWTAHIRAFRDRAFGGDMSCSATVEAQITVHSALSFLWGKFAPFPCCPVSWVSRSYLDFGVILDFLDACGSVTAPISPRGTLSSSGVRFAVDLPIAVKFAYFLY